MPNEHNKNMPLLVPVIKEESHALIGSAGLSLRSSYSNSCDSLSLSNLPRISRVCSISTKSLSDSENTDELPTKHAHPALIVKDVYSLNDNRQSLLVATNVSDSHRLTATINDASNQSITATRQSVPLPNDTPKKPSGETVAVETTKRHIDDIIRLVTKSNYVTINSMTCGGSQNRLRLAGVF